MALPTVPVHEAAYRPLWRWHLLAWLVYILTENALFCLGEWGYVSEPIRVSLIRSLITFPFAIALFYANAHVVVERYQPRRKWAWLLVATLLLLIIFVACRVILYRFGLEAVGIFSQFEPYGPYAVLTEYFLYDTLWLGLQYLLFSYGYWFAIYTIRLEREKSQLQATLFVSERGKLQAELGFLRNQLNPHFLFNTFNFLYAESLSCSPKLADSIMSLTVMMRAVTELEPETLVPLSQEIDYIRHYLKIQQYRFDERMNLHLLVEHEDRASSVTIPPLLFISLIENVFKHGDLSKTNDPASIRFRVDTERIQFIARNRKKNQSGNPYPKSSVGLTNIRQQLQQQYPNRHCLAIDDTTTHFVLNLTLAPAQPVAHSI